MKTLALTLIASCLLSLPLIGVSNDAQERDTVVIELNNKSKIIIYTETREELEALERYDINKIIKDLNTALGSEKINEIIIKGENGTEYLKDTTIVIGEGGAKSKIKVGNMELLVDIDDWDELNEEWEDNLPVERSVYEEESIDRTRHYFNVDLGLSNWLEGGEFPSGEDYAVKPWGSWYIGLNSVNSTWISGPLFFDWGLGVSWYNWKMENSDVLISQEDDSVVFENTEGQPNIASIKSKLSAPYVNVSFVPMFDFAKGKRKIKDLERGSVKFRTYSKQGIRFGVGMYAGYRLGGHSKFVYKEDGDREKDKDYGSFYLSNFRYGVRAQVGFKGLDLFATYDLNEVFDDGRGPSGSNGLNAISFGITL